MFKNWDVDKDIFMALSTKIFVLIVILLTTIAAFYPSIGHDYAYFIPRLGDTFLHYRLNGFSIQWYTPSFAGGLPAYPNPQHMQFSLPQFFTLLTTPWAASLLSIAVYSLVGFLSTFYFLKNILRFHWRASMLGALFFTGNGFYFQHMAVGHLGFQVFPLLSLILVLVFDRSLSKTKASSILALIGALLIYSAGFYPIAIFFLSFGITLPVLYLIDPSIFDWKRVGAITAGGLSLGLLLSASKISAVLSFMRYFPREITDKYLVDLGQAFTGLLLQLLGVMNLLPIFWLTGNNARDLSDFMRLSTGGYYGLWELDISISPVLIVIIFVGIVEAFILIRKKKFPRLSKKQWGAIAVLLFAIWVCIEFIFAKGILFQLLSNLPIVGSLHVNVRYAAAFIFPLILLGSVILNKWAQEWSEKRFLWISDLLSLLTIVFLLLYFFVADEQSRAFDMTTQADFYTRVRQGETFPIQRVQKMKDSEGLVDGVSGLETFDPIFGYYWEKFNHELEEGDVKNKSDGYYNLTNPAGLVFPEQNQLYLFERISVDDEKNLIAFIQHFRPDWQRPLYQRVFDIVSIFTCLILIGALGFMEFIRFRKRT